MNPIPHQYIDRATGQIREERLLGDPWVSWLYHPVREHAPSLFRLLTSSHGSRLLAAWNYAPPRRSRQRAQGPEEVLPEAGRCPQSARAYFQRKIPYWECRPMPEDPRMVISPADARVLLGRPTGQGGLVLKEKFFSFPELLGPEKTQWHQAFWGGEYALFRLTPDKYHWNHLPVSGRVLDFYELEGAYHSCNPQAVIELVTPFSVNRRTVTILNTDVEGGSRIGLVAMIEVAALMIGGIRQAYCEKEYENPRSVEIGMFLQRGQPKSLYEPGSSTDILLFQSNSIQFAPDLWTNQRRLDVRSRFTFGFLEPLVETDIKVRSFLAKPL